MFPLGCSNTWHCLLKPGLQHPEFPPGPMLGHKHKLYLGYELRGVRGFHQHWGPMATSIPAFTSMETPQPPCLANGD